MLAHEPSQRLDAADILGHRLPSVALTFKVGFELLWIIAQRPARIRGSSVGRVGKERIGLHSAFWLQERSAQAQALNGKSADRERVSSRGEWAPLRLKTKARRGMIDLRLRLVRRQVAGRDFTKIMPHVHPGSPDFPEEIEIHAA